MNLKIEDFYIQFTENAKEVSETISNLVEIIKKQNSQINELTIRIKNLEDSNK